MVGSKAWPCQMVTCTNGYMATPRTQLVDTHPHSDIGPIRHAFLSGYLMKYRSYTPWKEKMWPAVGLYLHHLHTQSTWNYASLHGHARITMNGLQRDQMST